jgi:hypothetical protein
MFPNIIRDSTGEILTGKIWRKRHGFFASLPFYSNIPRMEEMEGSLLAALGQQGSQSFAVSLLVVSQQMFNAQPEITNLFPENRQGT